jgi:ubiquinone/menaquinone biosynthesis C-methylase UbiE
LSSPQGLLGRSATSLRLRALDLADHLRGRNDPLVPPRRLNFVGDSDFVATGEEFRRHFHELADLQPSDRVLDIGCGIGRMARVLTSELAPPGSYDGFDVVAEGIEWCRARYSRPGVAQVQFRFTHADLRHPLYNPQGTGAAETFRFPYADASFDLVIATSVFTHLLDAAAEHYLAEIGRVLAPGGRVLTTWLLLDPSDPPVAGAARWSFAKLGAGAAQVGDPADPEAAVAYETRWLRTRLDELGLQLREPIHPGAWRGRAGRSFQDLVITTSRA